MISRPSDIWPKPLLDEYRRLAAMTVFPFELQVNPADTRGFYCRLNTPSFVKPLLINGQDHAGMMASVAWVREGPKIVHVTEEQYAALARVDVRLEVADFVMPYPGVLLSMPPGKMHQYVILHTRRVPVVGAQDELPVMLAVVSDQYHLHDIVTVARHHPGRYLEETLAHFLPDIDQEEGNAAHASLRVACNMMLAMTHYGHHEDYLFPKEVANERKYIDKGDRAGRDGRTASQRLAEQPVILTLERTVRLHRTEVHGEAGEPTGRQMPFHWRRGHWRKLESTDGAPRLVFVRPCMVRADLLTTSESETVTIYHGS